MKKIYRTDVFFYLITSVTHNFFGDFFTDSTIASAADTIVTSNTAVSSTSMTPDVIASPTAASDAVTSTTCTAAVAEPAPSIGTDRESSVDEDSEFSFLLTADVRQRRRAMVRARRKTTPAEPVAPLFPLPVRWTTTMGLDDSEPFLLYDNGRAERILVFGTEDGIRRLAESSVWHMDGTVNCPGAFARLYVIRAETADRGVTACVYAFLPNVRRETFHEVFINIVVKSIHLKSAVKSLSPDTIVFDFETGAMTAAETLFKGVAIRGSFHHLCRRFWRQARSLGLDELYHADKKIRRQLRTVPALAFLPVDRVTAAIADMRSNYSRKLLPLVKYFCDTFVGDGSRGRLLCAPELWNVRRPVADHSYQAIDHWNLLLNRLIGTSTSFWAILRSIQMDQYNPECRTTRSSRETQVYLKHLIEIHEKGEINDHKFLKKISRTILLKQMPET